MEFREQWRALATVVVLFLVFYFLPVGTPRFDGAVLEALHLATWYAHEHVLLCLVPAFFIAGAIGVFVSQASVMKYLGPRANKVLAYGVASVSGTILAVCSCTVLPLFGGIYKMGAGLGPACAFLYSGPAINVLAIVLTARVLGVELGVARAVGAVVFSVLVGLLMHVVFREDEEKRIQAFGLQDEAESPRPLWANAVYFGLMVAVLVFANWGSPDGTTGFFALVWSVKWSLTAAAGLGLAVVLWRWFGAPGSLVGLLVAVTAATAVISPSTPAVPFVVGFVGLALVLSRAGGELEDWLDQSWGFALQILPLLAGGVLVAGLLLGRPGHEGLIPSEWVAAAVGGNSWGANFFASLAGAFMYFATLTEVPILQGLMGAGMGKGPALAMLLAGPALSLPNMLVIRQLMGTTKTVVFVGIVVVMATISGILFGTFF